MNQDQPNIILVTIDSLRADHCGFVNPETDLTPTIDRLAKEGVAYTNAVAPGPRTPSSVPVLFTGEFILKNEKLDMNDAQSRGQQIRRHVSRFDQLSERLQEKGYNTTALTANPWTTRKNNFHRGFDEFYEIYSEIGNISSLQISDSTLFRTMDSAIEMLPGDPYKWSQKKKWFSQWTGSFDLIEEKITELNEPFFLWIFLLDTHLPYVTPRRFREDTSAAEMYYSCYKYNTEYFKKTADEREISDGIGDMLTRAYRDAVRSVDAFVDRLTELTDPFDPITVFHSDHGEALGERGHFSHPQTLFEENIRVPFVVHNSGASRIVSDQISLRFLPDMMDELTEYDFDPMAYSRPFVMSETEDKTTISIRSSRWKLVKGVEGVRLYDLKSDPEERTDVSSEYNQVTSSLITLLNRHINTREEKSRITKTVRDVIGQSPKLTTR